MKYIETKINLFDVPQEYSLVHCISADMALGAGIAKQIEERYHVRQQLRRQAKWALKSQLYVGKCYATGRVFNLVTKRKYYEKPTLETMQIALDDLYILANDTSRKLLAMPLIGCGLDKLKWQDVSRLIKNTFNETDFEILVCRL